MNFSLNPHIQELLEISRHVQLLRGVCNLLEWDQETMMPSKAAAARAEQVAAVDSLAHSVLISAQVAKVLYNCKVEVSKKPDEFADCDKALVRQFKRYHTKASKLPAEFERDLSLHSSRSVESWREARNKSDFSIFEKDLAKMVELKKKEAELLGYEGSPYNALLDQFEEGLTVEFLDSVFGPLKEFSSKLLAEIMATKKVIDTSIFARNYNVDTQYAFSHDLAMGLGFDFKAGRLDRSTHPFTSEFGTSTDVRITTRFFENQLSASIMATVHETGHALYEQGVDAALDSTCLGSGVSLGIHESQSRLWENMVGRSPEFWQHWYPRLVQLFPQLAQEEQTVFVAALNKVHPGFIRVDADEVTYNLHILLRYDIERDLIEGKIQVKDLPDIWNTKMNEYLGITPDTIANGVLQDIHWSGGAFGYFPTYSLGNLYAAQFWNALKKDIPNIADYIAKGESLVILNWLRDKIHKFGAVYPARELCTKVTGEELNSWYLMDYLNQKYRTIYGI